MGPLMTKTYFRALAELFRHAYYAQCNMTPPPCCPRCGAELLLDPDECDACGWPDDDLDDEEEEPRDDPAR